MTVPDYRAIPATIAGADLIAIPIPVLVLVPQLVFSVAWSLRCEFGAARARLRDLISRALNEMNRSIRRIVKLTLLEFWEPMRVHR